MILSRKQGEVLMIGDDVTVTVVEIKGGSVRLGISAPKAVSVHRSEIFERVQAEKRSEAAT